MAAMDDDRIRQLAQEVLADLARPAEKDTPGMADLETRVSALEAAVGGLTGRSAPSALSERAAHASFVLLGPAGNPGSDRCVMEPDKPCVQSGACRTFGH
jgi:hypothetical protein